MNHRADLPSHEFESPLIHAPDWPWSVAGWSLAAVLVLFFLIAWING